MQSAGSSDPFYIAVKYAYDSDPIELPLDVEFNSDGSMSATPPSLHLSTLTSQFADATSLRFPSNPALSESELAKASTSWRAVRCADGRLHAPPGPAGWATAPLYYVVRHDSGASAIAATATASGVACAVKSEHPSPSTPLGAKRGTVEGESGEEQAANEQAETEPAEVKRARVADAKEEDSTESGDGSKCKDLIVLGLAYATDLETMQEFFESRIGPLVFSEIKKDPRTGKSKGFGFVRFAKLQDQCKALTYEGGRFKMDGRYCEIRLSGGSESKWRDRNPAPPSRGKGHMNDSRPGNRNVDSSRKLFVGRIGQNIKEDDLRGYFSQFGHLTDVFVPSPCRGFGFVSFSDVQVAHSLIDQDHTIRGVDVFVSLATPRPDSGSRSSGGGSYDQDYKDSPRGYASQMGGRQRDSNFNSPSWGGGWSGGGGGNGWRSPPDFAGSSPYSSYAARRDAPDNAFNSFRP